MMRRLNYSVIPREVAESMRRILIDRCVDSAFCDYAQNDTLRSAQNDKDLFRTAV